jgi:hypothetical protein
MFPSVCLRRALVVIACTLLAAAAHAQLFRAYLASDGSDANPCTLPAPCRLLPAALNAVADGGEIWMLDSANYNTATVNITKSVSILAIPGAVGSIVAQNSGPAVSLTGGSLALRNVVIAPVAGAISGTHGVHLGGGRLTIENSLITNMLNDGVRVEGGGVLRMTQTTLRNNGGWAVRLLNGATADIAASQMFDNASGGVSAGGDMNMTTASVSDSIISGGMNGIECSATIGGTTHISVTRSTITRGFRGLLCGGSGNNSIYIGSNLVAHNVQPWSAGCPIYSAGNNQFNHNGPSSGDPLTPLPLQ